MQILFVNTTFGYVGGVEQHIILACDGLRLRGYSCSIAYQYASGRATSEFASHFNASYSLQSSTWKEVLDRDRPDCIYIHKWDSIQPILTAVGGGGFLSYVCSMTMISTARGGISIFPSPERSVHIRQDLLVVLTLRFLSENRER